MDGLPCQRYGIGAVLEEHRSLYVLVGGIDSPLCFQSGSLFYAFQRTFRISLVVIIVPVIVEGIYQPVIVVGSDVQAYVVHDVATQDSVFQVGVFVEISGFDQIYVSQIMPVHAA